MKNGIKEIIGKTIECVVTARHDRAPGDQLFLVFTDGTSLEIYGSAFNCCDGIDYKNRDAAIRYAEKFGGTIQTYPENSPEY